MRWIASTTRIPDAERPRREGGGNGSVMTMLPATRVDHVCREVHLPGQVAVTLQLELAFQIQLMPHIGVLPVLEPFAVNQAILMQTTDLIGIQMGDLHLLREVRRMLELLELSFEVAMIFSMH